MEKNWSDIGDLDLIFKVTGGQKMLKNALPSLHLLNGWMDFNETCTDKSLRDGKAMIYLCRFRQG